MLSKTMRERFYILTFLTAVLLLCSCEKNKVDEAFLESSDLCLIDGGVTIHTYDPLTWQVGYNESKKEFRVFNDTMSDYYVLTCSKLPTEKGQELTATVKWSGKSITTRNNVSFRVEKIDNQGRIWLWSKKSRIAVSVRSL